MTIMDEAREEWGRRLITDPTEVDFLRTETEWWDFIEYTLSGRPPFKVTLKQRRNLMRARELILRKAGVRYVRMVRRGITYIQPWGIVEKRLIRVREAASRIWHVIQTGEPPPL